MILSLVRKTLRPDERVLLVLRSSLWARPFRLIFSIVMIGLPFFLLSFFLRMGSFGLLGVVVLIAFALYINLRTLVLWSLHGMVITTERIIDIDQRGLFDREVSEVDFAQIQELRYNKKGILATLFGFGDLIVSTASNRDRIELHGVSNPEAVQETLARLHRQFSKNGRGNQPLTADELIRFVERIKTSIQRRT